MEELMLVNTVVLAAKLIMVCSEVDMNIVLGFAQGFPKTQCLERSGQEVVVI